MVQASCYFLGVKEYEPKDYKRLERIESPYDARALNFSCFHGQPFLSSERACGWMADALNRFLPQHECDLWAYCFMSTHVHLLVRPRGQHPSMSDLLESVKKSVSKRALARVKAGAPWFLSRMLDEQPNGRRAHRFWERGGGYDRNLGSAKAIWNMIDYIHRNPVEAKLCDSPAQWRWSSAADYTGVAGPLRITRCPVFRPVRGNLISP